ncbi:MAG TPA: hypothetical protein VJM79_04265 [Rhizorhapis sp.]|nr:hypothetical protein [Rhizorhapis sp.]
MHRRPCDPYFDKGLRGWIVKTARKHYWRVAAYHDLEDLIQEGMMAYAICRQRYQPKIKDSDQTPAKKRRHFMALVQVVFMQRITDMANSRTRGEDVSISQIAAEGKELVALEYLAGAVDGDQELYAALATAPAEIRAFLNMFDDPQAVADLEKPLRLRKDGTRETTNERIGTILGVAPIDFETTLRQVIGGDSPDDRRIHSFRPGGKLFMGVR